MEVGDNRVIKQKIETAQSLFFCIYLHSRSLYQNAYLPIFLFILSNPARVIAVEPAIT
jgi:hypothetical protein